MAQNTPSPMVLYVSTMNEAFGNPRGHATQLLPLPEGASQQQAQASELAWQRLQKQCENIGGKLRLTFDQDGDAGFINGEVLELLKALHDRDLDGVRDALCDIVVFALGAYHLAGLDADADMAAVLDGVMTRFCRNQDELERTVQNWAEKGVDKVYTHGNFPFMCVKASEDQRTFTGEEVPKGKFLKSVSYRNTVFPPIPAPSASTRRFFGMDNDNKGGSV